MYQYQTARKLLQARLNHLRKLLEKCRSIFTFKRIAVTLSGCIFRLNSIFIAHKYESAVCNVIQQASECFTKLLGAPQLQQKPVKWIALVANTICSIFSPVWHAIWGSLLCSFNFSTCSITVKKFCMSLWVAFAVVYFLGHGCSWVCFFWSKPILFLNKVS